MRAFQICTLVLAIIGSYSCEDAPTKQKRGVLGLGYGAGIGHLGSGGLAISGGYGGYGGYGGGALEFFKKRCIKTNDLPENRLPVAGWVTCRNR